MASLERQPTRGLYAVGAGLATLTTVPWHVLKSILPATRPQHSWSFQSSMVNPLIRSLLFHQAMMRIRTPLSLEAGSLGDRFQVMQPASADYYVGVLAVKPDIKPIPIPGVWYPTIKSRVSSKEHPVIMHIHGGCFVTLDARPGDMASAAKTICKISPRAFFSNYRLSSNPGGMFPAAIQDALTAYLFLLNHEGSGRNIVLSGDSAGANIILGLLRYVYGPEGKALNIEPPRAALLWSPWFDIASVHKDPGVIDRHRNAHLDYMNSKLAGWGASTVGTTEDVKSPFLTSIGHPFDLAETALWYQVGDAEVWYDEAVRSAEEMGGITGNKVQIHVVPHATHDILLAGDVTGFASHTAHSAIKAKEFLDSL